MGSFVLLKEGLGLSPNAKVIKAKEYIEYLEGKEIIERARKEAELIIEKAKKVYEEEKERGYQDGLLEGKMNISEQMLDTVAKTVNYFASIEDKVVEIVMEAIKKVLGKIPAERLIYDVVENALGVVRNQKQVTLRVSPEEVNVIKEKLDQIMSNFPAIHFIDVVSDSRLKKGGCIIETDIGVVDASIDVQLETIKKSLIKSFKKQAL